MSIPLTELVLSLGYTPPFAQPTTYSDELGLSSMAASDRLSSSSEATAEKANTVTVGPSARLFRIKTRQPVPTSRLKMLPPRPTCYARGLESMRWGLNSSRAIAQGSTLPPSSPSTLLNTSSCSIFVSLLLSMRPPGICLKQSHGLLLRRRPRQAIASALELIRLRIEHPNCPTHTSISLPQ